MKHSAWKIIEEKIPNIKIYLILIAITFIAYVNILPNGFLWDDKQQIIYNRLIQTPGHIKEIILSDSSISGVLIPRAGYYRPLQNLYFWSLYKIFGLNAWDFHLIQIILHIANVFLVFFVIGEILKITKVKHYKEISFLVAALFAVHSGISEAVQYVGAVGEPLSVLFALLSFYLLLRGIDLDSRTIKTTNIIWTTIFGFLALASKESTAAFFIFGFIFLFLFIKPNFKAYAKYLAGSVAATGFYLYLRLFIAKVALKAPDQPVPIDKASFIERIQTIPLELATYLKIVFWPAKLQIYQNFVVYSKSFLEFWMPLLVLAIIFILFFIWITYQPPIRRKLGLFFFIGFGLFILPALNITPLSMTLAERWLYLPSIFLFSLILLMMFTLLEKRKHLFNIVALILLIVAIPALTIRTIIRDSNWKNELALSEHDIQYTHGNNASLENNYGNELFSVGKVAEAKTHFERSIVLMDDWSVSQSNLGAVYENEGDFEKAESYYQKAIDLADNYTAYQNMIRLLFVKMGEDNEAKNFIENQALRKFPGSQYLYVQLALIYYKEGDKDKAKELVKKALDLDPQNVKIRELYTGMQNNTDIVF